MEKHTLIPIIIVFVTYFALSHFYLKKKLGIKEKRRGMFSKNRNRYFLAIDFIIILLFIVAMIGFANYNSAYSYIFVFGLFITSSMNRGIEEWLLHRQDKAYYQEWLGITLYLAIGFILYSTGK